MVRIPKLKRGTPIYLVWIDSGSLAGWRAVEDLDADPLVCETLGWYIKHGKEGIVISLSKGDEDAMYKPYADCVTIPICAVRSLRRVKLP